MESHMVNGCWECFEHAIHFSPPCDFGLNGQSTLPCRARLRASHLIEEQEVDVAGTHVRHSRKFAVSLSPPCITYESGWSPGRLTDNL